MYLKQIIGKMRALYEGKEEKKLAQRVAQLIGSGLGPESFYEYLEDYSKDENIGGVAPEYGFDEDELDILIDAFDYIKDAKVANDLNTSKVKSSTLYKEYKKVK